MDILDDMGVSKLSAKVKKKKMNYSFKVEIYLWREGPLLYICTNGKFCVKGWILKAGYELGGSNAVEFPAHSFFWKETQVLFKT